MKTRTRTLTAGTPLRVIVAFTLPLLIGNLFQQVYQFTDAAVVGRMVGVDALAAVGASGSLVFLLIGFTFGASTGLGIPVARAFGAGDMGAMRRLVALGALISVGIAVAITAITAAHSNSCQVEKKVGRLPSLARSKKSTSP